MPQCLSSVWLCYSKGLYESLGRTRISFLHKAGRVLNHSPELSNSLPNPHLRENGFVHDPRANINTLPQKQINKQNPKTFRRVSQGNKT